MKTSVYVPDELWQRVQEAQPDASASQLLQDCLKAKFEKVPAYAVPGDDNRKRADTVAMMIQRKLVEAYQEGYSVGLSAISMLPNFELLWLLASLDFDLGAFKVETNALEYGAFDFDDWFTEAVEHRGSGAMYMDSYDFLPLVVRKGIADAMREAWGAVSGEGVVGGIHPYAHREPVAPAALEAPAASAHEEAPDAASE